MAGTVAIINSLSNSREEEIDNSCTKKCPPCEPYPVDTIGYQGPKTTVKGKDSVLTGTGAMHYILFVVQQNPNDCKCRWQESKKIAGHHYYNQPNIFSHC